MGRCVLLEMLTIFDKESKISLGKKDRSICRWQNRKKCGSENNY